MAVIWITRKVMSIVVKFCNGLVGEIPARSSARRDGGEPHGLGVPPSPSRNPLRMEQRSCNNTPHQHTL